MPAALAWLMTERIFVPNISFGAVVVEALRSVTRLPLEVHLMITDPDSFFDEFVVAGASVFGNPSGVAGGMNDLRAAIEQATN